MPNQSQTEQSESTATTLGELAQHILLITVAFLLIFGVAIGLDQLIEVLSQHGLIEHGTPLEWALLGAKYAILLADLSLFCGLLYKRGVRSYQRF